MNRRMRVIAVFLVASGIAYRPADALAQPGSLKQRLVGTWSFTSTTGQHPDGTRFDVFGPNPKGIIIFSPDGHFALINTRPGRSNYVSGNRMDATPEEYKATGQGSIAYFGTYTVDESRKAFALHIEGSTFPNYEGTDQLRPFTIVGDELRSVNPAPTVGGPALSLTLRRAR